MRFYQDSRWARALLTVVCSLTAILGAFQLLDRRWFQGVIFLFLGCTQTWSLWNRYWETRYQPARKPIRLVLQRFGYLQNASACVWMHTVGVVQ